ncbi:hypothetical protein BSKO_12515 [Bryopsis sp. KO-2023]|nr:hypothetical protein BSKO_12515 [Bryopsis sp. KO-2023]
MVLVLDGLSEMAEVLSEMSETNQENAATVLEAFGTVMPMTMSTLVDEYLNRKLHLWPIPPMKTPIEYIVEPNFEEVVNHLKAHLHVVGSIAYTVLELLNKVSLCGPNCFVCGV